MYRDARVGTSHSLRRRIGVFCLAVGFVGLLLPLIPGIPLLIIGALLLRPRHSLQRYERHDGYVTDSFRDDVPLRVRRPRRRLSAGERLQLGFLMCCRAVTTRLDRHARRR